MLDRWFQLQIQGTTLKREVLAGLTTFAAMAYILAVNPAILSSTGMDAGALVTATALASAVGCLCMALLTNYPIGLAPGMGLNAFFTYDICLGMNLPWQGALALVFWNGVLFVVLSITGLRTHLVKAIPHCLRIGIQAGIGLFIVMVGLKNSGVIVDHPATLLTLGNLSTGWIPNGAGLAILGFVLAAILSLRKIPGAILLAMAAVTLIGLGIPLPDSGGTLTPHPTQVIAWPASLGPLFGQLDWFYPFRHWETAWVVVLSLLFVDLFDSIGTLIAVSRQARLTDDSGELPKMSQALVADAAATSAGAVLGTSPVTSYIESAAGVEAGGKTGLTSLTVAACFCLAIFFHPVILCLPAAATAPALILVGLIMMGSGWQQLDWQKQGSALCGTATALLIPLSSGIANGIALGCIIYTLLMLLTGERKKIHPLLAILSLLFLIKFAAVPH